MYVKKSVDKYDFSVPDAFEFCQEHLSNVLTGQDSAAFHTKKNGSCVVNFKNRLFLK